MLETVGAGSCPQFFPAWLKTTAVNEITAGFRNTGIWFVNRQADLQQTINKNAFK